MSPRSPSCSRSSDILDRYPPTISGGQQQRTSLARALVRRADLSLLDEPMSQLEPQLRAILRARIKDYLIEHRMTTVFVTHDQTEAIALADRIAVMEAACCSSSRTPARAEGPAGQPVRRDLHRRAADEHRRCHRAGGRWPARLRPRPAGSPPSAWRWPARRRPCRPMAGWSPGAIALGIRPHRIASGRRPARA